MADVQAGESGLLTSKWGPLPVWVWGLLGLAVAWAVAKYRDLKNAATAQQDTTSAGTGLTASESQDVVPQFIIENQLPGTTINVPGGGGASSHPVPPPGGGGGVPIIVSPPGKGPHPPAHGGTPHPPKPPAKPPVKGKGKAIEYRVQHGDTLSTIAAKHGIKDWHTLWTYNTTPGNRPASTIAELKRRGPDDIVTGELILIPTS